MKRFKSLVLSALIIVSLFLSIAPIKVSAATTWKDKCEYVATTTALNVRVGPGTSYAKKDTVGKGHQVLRISAGSNGWSKVIVDGEVGYMSSAYLKAATYKKSIDESKTNIYSDVTFSRINEIVTAKQDVNIRKGPGTSYDKIGTLSSQQAVTRLGVGSNGWSQIIYQNKIYYVKTSYLASLSNADTLPPSPPIKEEAPTTPPSNGATYQTRVGTNVRKGMSTSSAILGLLPKGTTFVSMDTIGNWVKFYYNGQVAYVHSSCVNKVSSTPVNPVPTPPNKDENKQEEPPVEESGDIYYTTTALNVRTGPSTSYRTLGTLSKGAKVTVLGKSGSWRKINYNGQIAYCHGDYLTKSKPQSEAQSSTYPMTYKDSTCEITIYKEWYENAYVYTAHVVYTDYDRLWVECAKGKYNSGTETTSAAAKRVGAILAINGDYATPGNGASGYAIARHGVVCNNKKAYPEGVYNSNTGMLLYGQSKGISGQMLSDLVKNGTVTDTLQFGPAFLIDGKIIGQNSGSRAQRTFVGTNGKPGDIWLCVSDGRKNDGKSDGLNAYQCAKYLKEKGCTLGIPLDGGGSTTMYFNGKVLNAAKNGQRAVADFVMFK